MRFAGVNHLFSHQMRTGRRFYTILFSLLVIGFGVGLVGCKDRKALEDRKTFEDRLLKTDSFSLLEHILERPSFPAAWRERAKAAWLELRSPELCREPLFVYASVSRIGDPNDYILNFMCFDEARDLLGIRIRERQVDGSEVTAAITEDYPVFVDSLESCHVERRVLSVKIRATGQRKDEGAWLDYENRCLNAVLRDISSSTHAYSESAAGRDGISKQDMPSIYVSFPDPNRVKVEICAYDGAGRASDWIDVDGLTR